MAARRQYRYPVTSDDGQRPCARGDWCSSQTRDDDGTWHPASGPRAFCDADRGKIITCAETIPAAYRDLAGRLGDPVRSGRAVRIPPGSRVLVSADIDALMRTMAAVLGGWAARVRAVPGLKLVPNEHPHGAPEAVKADCDVLARHPDPLLALPPGPALRTWTFPPAKPGSLRPAAVPCRRCRLPLSPSPSGLYWWPAACTHQLAAPVTIPAAWGATLVTGWRCQACGAKLAGDPGRRRACRHEPSGPAPLRPGGIPADVEAVIAGLEVVYAGDGWVTCVTDLGGDAAGLDIIEFAGKAARLLGETPAKAETLDGVPCRSCEAMSALELLEQPPPDPAKPAPLYCRCRVCKEVMTRAGLDAWAAMYVAWTRGSGILTCRRCDGGDCRDCCWSGCTCRLADPPRHARAGFGSPAVPVSH
jgi:hypothetical protein